MPDLRWGAAALSVLLLASCAPRPAPPAVPPPPPPAPQPPAPPPPPAPRAWQDAPISPGDWSLGVGPGGAEAAFGSSERQLLVRCEPNRQVSLSRIGGTGDALTVRTSNSERALPASPRESGLAARLDAGDPLLDAIVFSRGRFAVEAAGVPLLIVPAWPEPARVIEDCRG
ncbi:MAG TPA: hypothetical protein VN231_11610 [Allosphingosinicella sp.]|nr:hypothetical protein [Allosphingosinicella sp.]